MSSEQLIPTHPHPKLTGGPVSSFPGRVQEIKTHPPSNAYAKAIFLISAERFKMFAVSDILKQEGFLSSENVFCQRALYVEPLTRPIEDIDCPLDGHEYVHLARREVREIFPDMDFPQCVPASAEATDDKVDKPFSLKQWKKDQAYIFSHYALEIKKHRNYLKRKFPQKKLPPIENEKDVCLFCLGSDSCNKIFKDENVGYVEGQPPLLSHVIHLSQDEIFMIVSYMSVWMNEVVNDDICRWLHSLLACLTKPVSDDCEEFLEKFYDDCVRKIKNCKETGKIQLHFISAILLNYFCVKTYKIGASLDDFKKLC